MNTDKPLGAGLIALGIIGIAMTMQINVNTFNDDPGPKLFPMFGFVILAVSGLGMLLTSGPAQRTELTANQKHLRLVRGTTMAVLFILYSLGLWQVGFYLATPIMVYAFYHVIAGTGRRTWWKGGLYALAVTGGVHLVFSTFLHTLLPQGSLF